MADTSQDPSFHHTVPRSVFLCIHSPSPMPSFSPSSRPLHPFSRRSLLRPFLPAHPVLPRSEKFSRPFSFPSSLHSSPAFSYLLLSLAPPRHTAPPIIFNLLSAPLALHLLSFSIFPHLPSFFSSSCSPLPHPPSSLPYIFLLHHTFPHSNLPSISPSPPRTSALSFVITFHIVGRVRGKY